MRADFRIRVLCIQIHFIIAHPTSIYLALFFLYWLAFHDFSFNFFLQKESQPASGRLAMIN